jgi:hypothetical protein
LSTESDAPDTPFKLNPFALPLPLKVVVLVNEGWITGTVDCQDIEIVFEVGGSWGGRVFNPLVLVKADDFACFGYGPKSFRVSRYLVCFLSVCHVFPSHCLVPNSFAMTVS